jgi:hypothetical protein
LWEASHDVITIACFAFAVSAAGVARICIDIAGIACAGFGFAVFGTAAARVRIEFITRTACCGLASIITVRAVVEICFSQRTGFDTWQTRTSRNDTGIFVVIQDFAAIGCTGTCAAGITDFLIGFGSAVYGCVAGDFGARCVAVFGAACFAGIQVIT